MIEATTLVQYLEQIHYNLLYILYQLVSRSSGGRREHNEGKTCAPSRSARRCQIACREVSSPTAKAYTT